jgi:N-acetylglucosaminyldiphosphoundecaprenol N-acetyl-beta-D-mannosaminyltransferase
MCEFLGLRFWDVNLARAARFLVDKAAADEKLPVFFVNAHCVNVAGRNHSYADLLRNSPLLFADGVGMALAARMSGVALHNNVNGTDLFPELCRAAAESGVPVAFLGARPGVALACAERMQRVCPGLDVAWADHGYLSGAEERAKLDELNASGAKMLFVAKGVPTQECWIAENSARLTPGVILGVGALFDFYSGTVPRAPRLMRDLRMEWCYRLLREPRRLSARYLLGNPEFIARALLARTFDVPFVRRDGP